MARHLKAVYEDGVFRPLEPVFLKEHQEIVLSITDCEEKNLADIAKHFFGEKGVELDSHPSVTVRAVANLDT